MRRGISLLEVLISIFVLAIGLLSASSLIVAGRVAVEKGVIQDRRADIAQQAVAEARARGFFSSFLADHDNNAATPVVPHSMFMLADGTHVLMSDLGTLGQFAIDPLGIIANGTAAASFPYDIDTSTPAPTPVFTRVTVKAAPNRASASMSRVLANTVFYNQDSILFENPDDEELPPTDGFTRDASGNLLNRSKQTQYSWLVTMQPIQPGQYLASFVVFKNRLPLIDRSDNEAPLERAVVGEFDGDAFGGGNLNLSSTEERDLRDLRTGDWVLINGQSFHSQPTASPPNIILQSRWYRVQSVGEIQGTGPYTRFISTGGPDWRGLQFPIGHARAGQMQPVVVSLFEDVQSVIERVIYYGN